MVSNQFLEGKTSPPVKANLTLPILKSGYGFYGLFCFTAAVLDELLVFGARNNNLYIDKEDAVLDQSGHDINSVCHYD